MPSYTKSLSRRFTRAAMEQRQQQRQSGQLNRPVRRVSREALLAQVRASIERHRCRAAR